MIAGGSHRVGSGPRSAFLFPPTKGNKRLAQLFGSTLRVLFFNSVGPSVGLIRRCFRNFEPALRANVSRERGNTHGSWSPGLLSGFKIVSRMEQEFGAAFGWIRESTCRKRSAALTRTSQFEGGCANLQSPYEQSCAGDIYGAQASPKTHSTRHTKKQEQLKHGSPGRAMIHSALCTVPRTRSHILARPDDGWAAHLAQEFATHLHLPLSIAPEASIIHAVLKRCSAHRRCCVTRAGV